MSMKSQKSRSYTLALWSFVLTYLFVFLGIIGDLTIGSFHVSLKMLDAGVIAFLLTPALALYGFRRYTDALYNPPETPKNNDTSVKD